MVFSRGDPEQYRFIYDVQVYPRQDYSCMYEEFV